MPSKTLEYFISTQHWLDALTPPMEQHLHYLVNTMRAILAQKPDGSGAAVREPQLKPPPVATAITPPVAAAAPVTTAPTPEAAITPAAPGAPKQKLIWPVAVILLVLALGAATVAAVLWQRRDRPTASPVAVTAPEKPLTAGQAPNPVEPEGRAQGH